MIRIYFWKVSSRHIPWAILRMGLDRISLWRASGISFWKLLGAGKGETFTPKDGERKRLVNSQQNSPQSLFMVNGRGEILSTFSCNPQIKTGMAPSQPLLALGSNGVRT
jgi:hypothetical protein